MRYNVQYNDFIGEDLKFKGIKDRQFETLDEAIMDSIKLLIKNKEIAQASIRDKKLDDDYGAWVNPVEKGSSRMVVEYSKLELELK